MATNKDSKKPLAKLSKRIGHEDLKFWIQEDNSKQKKTRIYIFRGNHYKCFKSDSVAGNVVKIS